MQLATHIENQITVAIKEAIVTGAEFPITTETHRGIKHTIAIKEISDGTMITTLDVDGKTFLIYLTK